MLRLERGLTQEELAQRAGVSKDTLSKAERDVRRLWPRTVYRLAQALGVQPGELLRPEGEVVDLAAEGYGSAAAAAAEAAPEERQRITQQDRQAAIDAIAQWVSDPERDFWLVEATVARYITVYQVGDGSALDVANEVTALWREAVERVRQS